MHSTITTTLSLVTLTALLIGCGESVESGSSSHKYYPTNSKRTGYFIDSGVRGLEYHGQYGSNGTTQTGGSFQYNYGEILEFAIGNIQLGKTIALSTITPKEIVSYENQEINTSIFAPQVNNRVRLLISLDADNNPANGIYIDAATREQAKNWSTPDFSLSESEFTTALNAATNNEISSIATNEEAQDHFASTLRCVYSGAYKGNWILSDGSNDGFVGIMIQSDGHIFALGDGQDTNGDGNFSEVIYSTGLHDMDSGTYYFDKTYHFDQDLGSIVGDNLTDIYGTGISQGYNQVFGSFIQNGREGKYSAFRVGEGKNVSLRYTGEGYLNNDGNADDPMTDPLLGLFSFDISRDGNITGMIHDARTNLEPSLAGQINFDTGDVNISIDSPDNYSLVGQIAFDGTISLQWNDVNGLKLGYIKGIGCELQTHQ
jgi:hypothetical protein